VDQNKTGKQKKKQAKRNKPELTADKAAISGRLTPEADFGLFVVVRCAPIGNDDLWPGILSQAPYERNDPTEKRPAEEKVQRKNCSGVFLSF